MIIFINYSSSRLKVNVNEKTLVQDVKAIAEEHFHIDTSSRNFQEVKLVLTYGGCELKDEWLFHTIPIPNCSILKCELAFKKQPDFYVYVKFKKKFIELYNTDLDAKCRILELRILLAKIIGLPLSVFRLKTLLDVEMFDAHKLLDYDINKTSKLVLETWADWDLFLNGCVKGLTNQVIESFNSDDNIRRFQIKVALFISAFHGNQDLANTMISMGARADRPVGEHPCRQWMSPATESDADKFMNRLKLEYQTCPIHVAVINNQLKIIMQMFTLAGIQVLQKQDGQGRTPWDLAIINIKTNDPLKILKRKEVATFLCGKIFSRKIIMNESLKVSVPFYCKILDWCDSAREKVFEVHGFKKSSYKKNPHISKVGLLGNKVLIDGFNNDFRDYPNAFKRLRKAHKHYYFINDEEKEKWSSLLKSNCSRETNYSIESDTYKEKHFMNMENDELKAFSNRLILKPILSKSINLTAAVEKPSRKPKNPYGKNALYLSNHLQTIKAYYDFINNSSTFEENAAQSLIYANSFKSKTWLQQVQLSSQITTNNLKNSFHKTKI